MIDQANVIELNKFDISIRIKRSNRRSLVCNVLPTGEIEICAPIAMTTEEINEWLDKVEHRLRLMVDECRRANANIDNHPFGYGGEVLYKGEWLPIKESEDDNCGDMALMRDRAVVLKPRLTEVDMRRHIGWLFADLAKPIFEKKLLHYSDLMHAYYKTWTIGNARLRHGSCDNNRRITLSWRVVMMSESVMDYLIVHELAHLKHMNHSKAFHDEVAAVLPDWKDRQSAHNEYSYILRCGGWM